MKQQKISTGSYQRGSILVSILVMTLFLTMVIYGIMVLANANVVRSRGRILLLQAQYAAESGADAAISSLNNIDEYYTGTGSPGVTMLTNSLYKATYETSVTNGANGNQRVITSTGKVFVPANAVSPQFSRRIQITAERSSSTAASSMVSRNIISMDSGVKNVKAVDVYVNGFITMSKNTTNLIAENITVAGKNTGASNCSIGGTGNLIKPTTFTHTGQTKTNIITAFNNCISPPGNTTNANFTVQANQTNVSTINSTYIPWSQFMDNTYQNSPSGCSDWTTGTFPRSIPSTGNAKKTHYPDSVAGISSSCGTAGNIQLSAGQYTITNHAHIRASLCATSACTPTFYNPDTGAAGIKFVFVEGSVNFASVQTASGSGPIVIVSYGSDPAGYASVCPYGGSIYVGNSSNTNAKALYLLASNGLCMDKTKFGSAPALGGISGKNLHVSTNPGTPFDLELDPSFPTGSIPINLSWKATRYQRL